MATRHTGKVKWFNDAKGYGFIEPTGGGPDIFVHYSAIEAERGAFRTLREGDTVEYEVTDSPKGAQAESVIVL